MPAKAKITAPVSEPKPPVEGLVEGAVRNEKYYESVGRRKNAIARVRLITRKSTDSAATPASDTATPTDERAILLVNGKDYLTYFKDNELRSVVEEPFRKLKSLNRFKATIKVNGGGMRGQADAIAHGLARSLILFDENFGKKLRKSGHLTRDSRVKERRKYGLKKARKAPQWAKR